MLPYLGNKKTWKIDFVHVLFSMLSIIKSYLLQDVNFLKKHAEFHSIILQSGLNVD